MALHDDSFRNDLRRDGYSKEEKYFYELNRELIERRRKELDPARAERQSADQGHEHWMRCPKCGGTMETQNLLDILVEECPQCHGIYMDRGELETILSAHGPHTFFSKLKKAFMPKDKTPDIF